MINIYNLKNAGRNSGKSWASYISMSISLKLGYTVTFATNLEEEQIIKSFKNFCDLDVHVKRISSKIYDIKL